MHEKAGLQESVVGRLCGRRNLNRRRSSFEKCVCVRTSLPNTPVPIRRSLRLLSKLTVSHFASFTTR